MVNGILLIFLLALILAPSTFFPSIVHGQNNGLRGTLPNAKLDILLEPIWSEEIDKNEGTHAKFRVSFLRSGTDLAQQHVDYGFVITKKGNQAANAAPSCQAILHTAEGVVTIPCQFQLNGDYLVEVSVYGIFFSPVDPESVAFPIKVTPEFPFATTTAVAGLAVSFIMSAIRLKRP